MNLTVVLIGLIGLYLGTNWVVDGASRLARSFGVSELATGLVLVTLITASPELLIGINAALNGADGLIFGAVAGSTITNIGLVLGLGGLAAGGLKISTTLVRRGVPVMFGIGVIVYAVLWLIPLSRALGVVFILAYIGFVVFMIWQIRRDDGLHELARQQALEGTVNPADRLLATPSDSLPQHERINRVFEGFRLVAGIVFLLFGADAIVTSGANITAQLGASAVVVGVTLVAVATALPELVAVMAASDRRLPDVALGNVIGSSVANVLLVLGVAALVNPLTVDPRILRYEFPVMLGFMALMLLIVADRKLTVWESAFYLVLYVAFFVGIFLV
ncbi:MAG: sodium:calcium antiporter [Phototrophicaceae bacterium]|jgi:cation:H+ antiporter